ncbi:MAG: phosphoglycerate dehydrogenase [Synergistetes bacterium]|nr:phosphoglycerate dehydrogenase [Synergistota bacterium]
MVSVIKELVQDVDAIIVGLERIDEEIIKLAPKLKVISKHGIGVDNIDIQKAKEAGIVVTNVPYESARAVAELAFALILACARRIVEIDNMVRKGEWKPIFGFELKDKILGIIGIGAIGSSLGEIALGFGMRVIGYDIKESDFTKKLIAKGASLVDFETCLRESDVLSLHVPLTEETKKLIGKEELRKMKKTAILINTSRGEVIDEEALYEALKEGWIAGAGLDVLSKEPPEPNNPLLSLPNVVITSHVGAYTYESMNRVSMLAAQNVVETILKGKPLFRVV